ncbi:MAG TPA: hypothetical protein VFQ91_11490 [Bryobacteraceae bacterium]|nr:hypothetical protein [Bryobacteraceae bacterium]
MKKTMYRRDALKGIALAGAWGAGVLAAQEMTRTFRMGFTPFPLEQTVDGWTRAFQTISRHGDLTALFIQDGLPWEHAFDGKAVREYPSGIRAFLEFQLELIRAVTPSQARYLAFNPLSVDYRGLAASWTDEINEPLLYPWNTYDLDHAHVKQVITNHLRALVDFFEPQYLNVGIEVNILLARNFDHWPAYLDLHRHLYTELKKSYPKLPVFTSIQYEHLLGLHGDSIRLRDRLSETYPDVLINEVKKLLQYSDILAISTYPHMIEHLKIDAAYYGTAKELAQERRIPLAVDQTGFSSVPLQILGIELPGSEAAQEQFIGFILREAVTGNFQFVVNFIPVDYGTAYGVDPVALSWAYTGMYRPDGTPKPALSVWDAVRASRFQS